MPVAFTHIDAEVGRIDEILHELLQIDEIVEAYSVTGPHSILAKVEAKKFGRLTDVIPEKIHKIEGVNETLTQIAFGTSMEFRRTACDEAKKLAEKGEYEMLYELCRDCEQLKHCAYGARVVTYGF